MRRSPEARLAGRLFDGDKIVKPLLDSAAEQFYVESQKLWEWNSRYWEQRALLKADSDLVTALRYAKQAVAIENHPFPLTTLAKLLLKTIEAEPIIVLPFSTTPSMRLRGRSRPKRGGRGSLSIHSGPFSGERPCILNLAAHSRRISEPLWTGTRKKRDIVFRGIL